jgi:hypothetical protein
LVNIEVAVIVAVVPFLPLPESIVVSVAEDDDDLVVVAVAVMGYEVVGANKKKSRIGRTCPSACTTAFK